MEDMRQTSETMAKHLGCGEFALLDDPMAWHYEESHRLSGPNGQSYHTGYLICCKCGKPVIYLRGDGTIAPCDPSQVRIFERQTVIEEQALAVANQLATPHGLRAEFLGDAKSVGIGGDCRTYTRVMVLIGKWPGDEVLAQISTAISNRTPINRVTYQLFGE